MLELRRRKSRGKTRSFREYVTAVKPDYVWHRHCELIADILQKVADGEIKRLMIFMPPQHGKSDLASRSLPGYLLERFPSRDVMMLSYGAELAHEFGIDAKARYEEAGGQLRPDAKAARRWRTPQGGGFRAAGFDGRITGLPAYYVIIDDPVKNEEDASSAVMQRKLISRWDSSIYTRVNERGAIILIQTRWHRKDLAGQLLDREWTTEHPEGWVILDLPAISEEKGQAYPPSCTVLPDFRTEPGQALCPEIRSLSYLLRIMSKSLRRWWLSIWQQRPTDPEGDLFKAEWFPETIYVNANEVPQHVARVRAWDKAVTEGGGDWTSGIRIARDYATGIYYIEDVRRGQWGLIDRDQHIRATAMEDERLTGAGRWADQVQQWFEQEPGSGGKESAVLSVRSLEGLPAFAVPPQGNKTARAMPLAAYIKAGMVRIVRASWNEDFKDELLAYRDEKSQSDQVDSAAHAFMRLALAHGDALNPHRGE